MLLPLLLGASSNCANAYTESACANAYTRPNDAFLAVISVTLPTLCNATVQEPRLVMFRG